MQESSICHCCKKQIKHHTKDEAISCALKIIKVDIEADPKMEDN